MGDIDIPQRRVVSLLAQRRPVHDIHLDLEARGLQRHLGDLGHLEVEFILARGQDAQRLAVIAGRLKEFGGFFGVVLVIQIGAFAAIPGPAFGIHGAAAGEELVIAKGREHHVIHRQRGLQRLADIEVGQQALLVVDRPDRPAEIGKQDRLGLVAAGDAVIGFDRQAIGEIELARGQPLDPGIGIGDGDEADLVDRLRACARGAVRRLAARHEAVEFLQADILVGNMLGQFIGAGADRGLDVLLPQDFLGIDRGGRVVERQQRQQRRIGRLERDHDRLRIGRADRFELLGHAFAARGDRDPALERIDHIGAVHGRPVMEGDAGPQLDRIGFAVGADLGQRLGQQRLDGPFAVEREQRLDDMLGHGSHHILRRNHRVHGLRLADDGDLDISRGEGWP